MSFRVGVAGWGDAGKIHARHLVEWGARLSGVVSPRNPGSGIPWFRSLEELLPQVDALSITTPNFLHAGMLIQAVRAGKAVLVEKPLCITDEELKQLKMILPGTDQPVHVGYRLRFDETIRRLYQPERIPRRVHCSYRLGIDRLAPDSKSWIRDPERSGGPFFILGVHCLDLVRWLSRARGRGLTEVVALADSDRLFPLQVSLLGRLGETRLGVSVDLRGSASYRLRVEIEWPHEEPRTVSLSGEEHGLREEAEFAGLTAAFAKAVEAGKANREEISEALQTHQELLEARRLLGG